MSPRTASPSIKTAWGFITTPDPSHLLGSTRAAKLQEIRSNSDTAKEALGLLAARSSVYQLSPELFDLVLSHWHVNELGRLCASSLGALADLSSEYAKRFQQWATSDEYGDSKVKILGSKDENGGEPCMSYTYLCKMPREPQVAAEALEGSEGDDEEVWDARTEAGWIRDGLPSPNSMRNATQSIPKGARHTQVLHFLMDQNPGARTESSYESGMCPQLQIAERITRALDHPLQCITVSATDGAFDGAWALLPVLKTLKRDNGIRTHLLINQERAGTSLKGPEGRCVQRTHRGGGVQHLVTVFDAANDSTFKYANSDFEVLAQNIAALTAYANDHLTHHTVVLPALDRAAFGLRAGLRDDEVSTQLEARVRELIPEYQGTDAEPTSLGFMSLVDAKSYHLSVEDWCRHDKADTVLASHV